MEMVNTDKKDPRELRIQGLLDRFLASQAKSADALGFEHLDEDSLSAFVDGSLTDRETAPVISHLVDCSFCRHVTSELVRLDAAFAEKEAVTIEPASKAPAKVSEVLSSLLGRIFGTGEAAVFAHGEKDDSVDAERISGEDTDDEKE